LSTPIQNLRVQSFEPIPAPRAIAAWRPLTDDVADKVAQGRDAIHRAMVGEDDRLLVITGPCSIHDRASALDYAERLARLRERVGARLLLVMRVYFEKPRTTVGWKGLINDPNLDGSHDINHGLKLAREILFEIAGLGVPCGTEFLDPIVPQYTGDLVSWAAIGARTTESQTHRQMASGLSMPVGFKNATDGGLQPALDAITAARHPHAFVGIDDDGRTTVVRTTGNDDVHLILRGGAGGPNWSRADVAFARVHLEEAGAVARPILIDCSHGNSGKDPARQPQVFEGVLAQRLAGERAILGMMLESHLVAGRQDPGGKPLVYGQSLTDGCIDWPATERLLLDAADRLG
jgi:3-deoxy-7-phosphoheptulonate synthase